MQTHSRRRGRSLEAVAPASIPQKVQRDENTTEGAAAATCTVCSEQRPSAVRSSAPRRCGYCNNPSTLSSASAAGVYCRLLLAIPCMVSRSGQVQDAAACDTSCVGGRYTPHPCGGPTIGGVVQLQFAQLWDETAVPLRDAGYLAAHLGSILVLARVMQGTSSKVTKAARLSVPAGLGFFFLRCNLSSGGPMPDDLEKKALAQQGSMPAPADST